MLLHEIFPKSIGPNFAQLLPIVVSCAVMSAVAAVPARAKGGREGLVMALAATAAVMSIALLLLTPDLEIWLALIPGFLVSGAIIDRRLRGRATVNGLAETAVATGAFIAGALVPAALFIGAFLVALSVA